MTAPVASLAIILRTDGHPLDLRALHDMPDAEIVRAELAEGERVACVTATVRHFSARSEFRTRVSAWARARGWQITVAPVPKAS